VMMPEMDGLALCAALKADDRLSDIPVLLLTAKGGTENRVEGLGVGADDYLEKPFEMIELQARVRGLIASRQTLFERYGREIHIRPTDVRIQPADEAFLEQARTVAEAHLRRRDFNTDAFADALHLTRGTLNRKLKAVAGLSPGAFIKHLRLERAAQLLRQDAGLTVYEIASAVGYKDADHFARVFRERFGVSPSQYKANGA
ncbi:MAG: helix-turn-helix domain-containing protein, partial [Rhodothermales bacterium]